jgi:hypothetical protein
LIPAAIVRESRASDRDAGFPGDPGESWSPEGVTRRIRATEKTATAIHGRYSDELLVNYVSERREMIKYPEFQTKGWQIGSGPTEATCKTLTARLKGSGMRWEANNAEALMALEALTQSGQWDLYWQSQLPRTG